MMVAGLALVVAGCTGSRSHQSADAVNPRNSVSEEDLRRDYAAHPEFRNQAALTQVKAHFAYARGATGKGVTLGIVDTGVDPDHLKFEGKLDSSNVEGYDPDFGSCEARAPDGSCLGTLGHGTFVGGIMAANRRAYPDGGASNEAAMREDAGSRRSSAEEMSAGSGSAIHGVAFDARVVSVGFPSVEEIIEDIIPENPTPEQVRDLLEQIRGLESVLEMRYASVFNRLNSNVTAVNCSFGLPGNIENFGAEALRGRFPNVIEAIAQADTPAGKRTVYVWAAGNAHGEINLDGSVESATSVEVVAGLPARIPELRGHSLSVVATDPQGRIAEFSNRCGIAKDFCLAAPGVDITGPVPSAYCPAGAGECYLTIEESGTSAAAPFVTGGIALLAQHYRNQLGNDEIVKRILRTANKTGAYADSDVYGQGFLDLDAATRPVGETRMLTSRSLSGPSALTRSSAFQLGAAFGDSLARGLAHREVASFDELDAPFFRSFREHLRPNAPVAGLGERLRTLGRDPRGASWRMDSTELRVRLDAVSTSHGAGAAHGPGSLAGTGIPDAGRSTAMGTLGSLSLAHDVESGQLLFGYRSHPGWQFGLRAGGRTADRGGGPVEFGTFTNDNAFANPFLGFARNGASVGYATAAGLGSLRIAAFHGKAQYGERRDADASEATGALAEYRFGNAGLSGLAMQAGWLTEAQGLVGSRSSGAFGELGGETGIVGLSAHRELGDGWSLLASAHLGMSHAEVRRHGMVRDPSALRTSSIALGLIGEEIDHAGGRLAFRFSQPLRVEAGHARLRWVSGRTPDGLVEVEEATLDLEPSGRQLDLELTYSRPWAGGQAHLAAIASRDAGHVRGENDAALLMRYSRAF